MRPAWGADNHRWVQTMPLIVLLEDDALLRLTLTELLESCGHTVHAARSEAEALQVCEAGRADGCVVVADRSLHFPDGLVDGHLIAAAALARWPEIGVVYTSGSPEVAERALSARERVLIKPFAFSALQPLLRELGA